MSGTAKRCIVILGMHRSGTSCLAGILEGAGVYLGNVMTKNRNNLKGTRENPKIMKLHDALFEYNGGSWDKPPQEVIWPCDLEKYRKFLFCHEYGDSELCGFKDPRTLFTLDGWLNTLPSVTLVATFRHPVSVTNSLVKRDKFTFDKCFNLWKLYNERLLYYHNIFNFPVISFDLSEKEYKMKMCLLLSYLNLSPISKALDFYDNSLKHYANSSDCSIPEDLDLVYSELCRIAL